tara:strand:+ start:2120 stop:2734 length:615 start_codon:yes stop_codon:yes gene_type:complete
MPKRIVASRKKRTNTGMKRGQVYTANDLRGMDDNNFRANQESSAKYTKLMGSGNNISATRRAGRSVGGRSGRMGVTAGTDAYGRRAASVALPKAKKEKKTKKVKKKSLSEIKSFLTGLQVSLKHGGHGEASTEARVAGTNVDTKIRQDKKPDKIRSQPKEVKTGKQFNLHTRVGDIATRGVRTSASELPTLAGELLKSFKAKWN